MEEVPNSTSIIATINVPDINIPAFSAEFNDDIFEWFDNYESVARAFNWNQLDKFQRITNYLQGTAKRWYRLNLGPNVPDENKLKDFVTLKSLMIRDLCAPNYRSWLYQQLNYASQQPAQSSIAFIYEMQELCMRIDETIPEIYMLSLIKEKLLPQIKYGSYHN